jgi:hypothetical protein
MILSIPWSSLKNKLDNYRARTLNSTTFWFRLKRTTLALLIRWKLANKQSTKPTRSWNCWTTKMKSSRSKLKSCKRNATGPRPNIRNFAQLWMVLSAVTRICQWNSRASKTLSDWPKASSTSQLSSDKTSEKTI